MRKLNLKNKIYILIFSIIILGILGILIAAAKKAKGTTSEVYQVNSNDVFYNASFEQLDSSLGGTIEKKWTGEFSYLNSSEETFEIGNHFVMYNNLSNDIVLFGKSYQIYSNGNVIETSENYTKITNEVTSFYKLEDRVYLIVSDEIYDEDKVIYAKNYLEVYLDTQGNASLLNNALNIKTINPIKLEFGNYTFDIANETLSIGDNTIDLKAVDGSTNQYYEREALKAEKTVDTEDFVSSYNELVNGFNQYATNNTIDSSGMKALATNTQVVTASSSNTNVGTTANNTTSLNKRVSLRGAVSNSTYIDVSYIVIDPEEKYQAVYLLVTGEINGVNTTSKIILDKYSTNYRIVDLSPRSEYSITLGYIEIVTDTMGDKTAYDYVEDTINLRTTYEGLTLNVDKISVGGYVYFTFKMSESYYLSSGKIALYSGSTYINDINIDIDAAKTTDGFSGKLKLPDGSVFMLKLTDAYYGDESKSIDLYKKFSI